MVPVSSDKYFNGQRVEILEGSVRHRGTVRYYGPVAEQRGEWVGIEWDDASRGKHDGTTGGHRYFHSSAGAASFVRPHKLNPGITLLEAIKRRYQSGGSEREDKDMYILSTHGRVVNVEFVGAEKIHSQQEKLDLLEAVSLEDSGIQSSGIESELRATLPRLGVVNLSGNLISTWQEIGRIVDCLPSLHFLNLSNNRISLEVPPNGALNGIRTLILNNCSVNWFQVASLEKYLPDLEELHLCSNRIQSLTLHGSNNSPETVKFHRLKVLSLESNKLCNWSEITKALENASRLEQLLLSGNKICSVESRPNGSSVFQNLQTLMLAHNNISEWSSVDSLNSFPSLKETRLTENPVTELFASSTMWYMLVARIGQISLLNGSEIKPRERLSCELRYVRYVMDSGDGKTEEQLCIEHPRFTILREKYDLSMQGKDLTKNAQNDRFIYLSFLLLPKNGHSGKPMKKKLPSSTTVGKLRQLIERLLKVKADEQVLLLYTNDESLPSLLDRDEETLSMLSVPDNAMLLVDTMINKAVLSGSNDDIRNYLLEVQACIQHILGLNL